MKRTLSGLAILTLVLAATPALAQPRDEDRPSSAFQFRVGGFFPAGGGQLWNADEQIFTLDHSDFNDGVLGFSYIHGVNNNFEVGFNVDFYDSTVGSIDRGFPAAGDLHPSHDTNLQLTPVTVDFRFLPAGRYSYRGKGKYRVHHPVPYLGAGFGMNFWRYEEEGYFIFLNTDTGLYESQFDHTKDDGTAFEAHVLAGLELPMGPTWSMVFEGRYSWARARVGNSYVAQSELSRQDLTLDGPYAFVGASWHF